MRQTLVLFKFVVIVTSFIAPPTYAQHGDQQADKREAHTWLRKIQSAAQKLNYAGTFVYQQGNQVRTSRITHVLEGRNEIEKLKSSTVNRANISATTKKLFTMCRKRRLC